MTAPDMFADMLPIDRSPDKVETLPTATMWPPEALKARHRLINDLAFERGFRQRPFSDSDRRFPHFGPLVEACRAKGYKLAKLGSGPKRSKKSWDTAVGVDLSGDKRPGNAIFALSVTPDRYFIPRVIRVGAWKSPELAAQCQMIDNRLRPMLWVVENNGYQRALLEWALAARGGLRLEDGRKLKLTWTNRLVAFTTGRNKVDPDVGIAAMDIEFSNGSWLLPMGDLPVESHPDGSCPCAACRWIREMKSSPNCETNDIEMACWFAWEALLRRSKHCRPLRETKKQLHEERQIREHGRVKDPSKYFDTAA